MTSVIVFHKTLVLITLFVARFIMASASYNEYYTAIEMAEMAV